MIEFNQKFRPPFNYIKLKLASPTRIESWAKRQLPNQQIIGEVLKAETINYRTFKTEPGGLFCERIFGPTKDFECVCGKYKHVRYEGLICDKCGVELIEASVRRHRMGCITLVYPATHVWYMSTRPNYMALILEVEQCEKTLNTAYNANNNSIKDRCQKKRTENDTWRTTNLIVNSRLLKKEIRICNGLKANTSSLVELWDERIQRINLTSLTYFIENDVNYFYSLHLNLQEYRRIRRNGRSRYPLEKYSVPLSRQPHVLEEYYEDRVPFSLLGAPLIRNELLKIDLKLELPTSRMFILECTRVLQKESPEYNYSNWFRKWEYQRIHKLREQELKRIRILENLKITKSSPAWMIFTIVPIIPPSLRPMIRLESGRLATDDLNELYRNIIARNNRLLKLLHSVSTGTIIRNERRMLQEAVDNLIDNGKRGNISLSANNEPLKSLSEIIKGKEGRFRQNLLGKRVDYSGRSVIVVGPSLKLNQCGLPYEMATELFQPFIIRELINQGLAHTMKIARNLIQKNEAIIYPILEKLLKNHPIFLNRAPTLHRLGVQAFEAILVRGRAIKLHPLVCSGFNADFDGDQMAVHIPLSVKAQAECYTLLFAPYNFLSPANGEPILVPSQDMVLGCYYLTVNNIQELLGSHHYFANLEDVILAYDQNKIEIHSTIWVRIETKTSTVQPLLKITQLKDETILENYKDKQIRKTKTGETLVQYLKTTTGRVILNSVVQKTLKVL